MIAIPKTIADEEDAFFIPNPFFNRPAPEDWDGEDYDDEDEEGIK